MTVPQRLSIRLFPISLLLLAILAACGGEEEAPGAFVMDQHEYERWEIALVEMRIEKNDEFQAAETSPLPADTADGFEGLNYYFPEPSLRFHTLFDEAPGQDTVKLVKRKGAEVDYLRRGYVTFRHDDRIHRLAVFGPVDTTDGDYLWLPFHDKTSGDATYAGGRYLDITLDAEGWVDLDFNYAYNPLCDYNPERYNCTLPPPENLLDFPVLAGEMRFSTVH